MKSFLIHSWRIISENKCSGVSGEEKLLNETTISKKSPSPSALRRHTDTTTFHLQRNYTKGGSQLTGRFHFTNYPCPRK